MQGPKVALVADRGITVPSPHRAFSQALVRRRVVIALFTRANDTIATAGIFTGVGAGVGIDVIAIVALFAGANDVVATSRILAVIGTGIGVDVVAIVTLLAGANNVVATPCIFAGVGAGIGVDVIAIVTLFTIGVVGVAIATEAGVAGRGHTGG